MDFYFQNNFLEFNPYVRKLVKIIKDALNLILFVVAVLFAFSDIFFIKLWGILILLIFLVLISQKSSHEDIRQNYHNQNKLNLNNFLDKETQNFLIETITKAEILKPDNFQTFLFNEFLEKKNIKKIFFRLNLKISKINIRFESNKFPTSSQNFINQEILPMLICAFDLAKSLNFHSINLLILFLALKKLANQELKKIFETFDVKDEYLLSAIIMQMFSLKKLTGFKDLFQPLAIFQKKVTKKHLLNKALTSKQTNVLDFYGVDFTYLANQENAGFLIGHKKELQYIIENLRQGDNILLIGDEGTGKETIILHLAWLIQNEFVPKELLDFRLVKLDLSLVYSQNKEKFLEILTKIVTDVIDSGYIILYLPYIEKIILEKDVNVFQILDEVLRSKQIPIIATISRMGYEKTLTKINLDPFFEKIEIQALSEEESIFLLTLKSILWEKKERVIITPQAISTAVILANKFLKDEVLPNSAEEVIIDGLSLVKKNKGKFLTKEIIQEIIFEKTKIPIKTINIEEKEKLLNLENLLHQRIVDQDQAIREIARVLRIYRAGLARKKGPIGVFLFVGPTGVGKTETAKALAKIYYGSEKSMLRLDMVEFQNAEDLDKLIGTKDGQIVGRLTEPIRQNPYSLILLDEFEKTHPTILKIFLPIFDEGFIKDALGREVDFTNSLIICTSNAYSELIKENIEKGIDFDKIINTLKSKLSNIFSIELLNRFDNVVVYKPLSENDLIKIAELMINDLKGDILLKHGVDLEISLAALKKIVSLGTDPIFGARPLQRKINEIIKSEIANLILANKVSRGNKIFIDFNEEFKFVIK